MTVTFDSSIADETKIWRYMGFTKFVSFLEYGLYFCRADKFEDQFEGALAVNDNKLWTSDFKYAKKEIITEEQMENYKVYIEHIKKLNSYNAKAMRKYVVINCWHMNEYESEAMWKLYSQNSEGIAIQSTYARLKENLDIYSIYKEDDGQFINIAPVKYIDHNKDNTSEIPDVYGIAPFLHKRQSFKHEEELRVLISHPIAKIRRQKHIYEQGKFVGVNYEQLIEKIYIAPTLPGWFQELIKDVLKRYGLENIPVVHSTLDEPAIF